MKNYSILLSGLFALSFCLIPSQEAQASVGHAGFDAGGWYTRFHEEGFGHTVDLKSDINPALRLYMGANFGLIFIDYVAEYYKGPTNDTSLLTYVPSANDMDYWSILGFNLGLSIPIIRLHPYVGAGIGNLGFNAGTKANASGTMIRAGVSWDILSNGTFSIAPSFEYQHLYLTRDGSDAVPDGFTERADTIFLGLGIKVGS